MNNDVGEDFASEELVTEVKALQRQDPNAKASWVQYTDQYAAGKRDPAKHSGEFVRQFIQAYHAGTLPPCNSDNSQQQEGGQLPMCTKFLQRKYPAFKQVWASYCSQFGNGYNDPMRHDLDYHARFFNWLASQAGMSMGLSPHHSAGGHMASHGSHGGGGYSQNSAGGGMGGHAMNGGKGGMHSMGGGGHSMQQNSGMGVYGGGAPPQKRMRTDDYSAAGGGSWSQGVSTGDPRKDTLVHSLKAFKRMGDDYKNLWGMYCDTYLGGIRDPARHTTETLQEFITNHHVPIVSPGQTGSPAGMMRATNTSAPGPRITHPPITDQMDPMKAQLVQSIKDYQKQGQEAKETWANFAGITRDPARHDIGLLKEFATMHNLL